MDKELIQNQPQMNADSDGCLFQKISPIPIIRVYLWLKKRYPLFALLYEQG